MPQSHSAYKRMIQSQKRRLRNQATLSELKTLTKRFQKLLTEKPKEAPPLAKLIVKKFDKAASRGIIPKKRADRKKSRIARALLRHGAFPS